MSKRQKSPDKGNLNSIYTSLRELIKSIKAKRTLVFCGAGISRHSGLPIVNELVPYILEKLGVAQDEIKMIVNSNLPFESFIETLSENSDPSKIFDIFDIGEPNTNHSLLAKLAKVGYVTTICTTNFDRLIEKAFDSEGLARGDDYQVYYKEDDFDKIDWQEKIIRLIKIHGSIEDKDNMAITLGQVASKVLSDKRKGVIDHIFCKGAQENVLVLGYSCSDGFDISPQIEAIRENHKRVIFIDHNKDKCVVKSLSCKNERNPFHHFRESKWILYDTDKLVKAISNACFSEEEFFLTKSAKDKTSWQKCVDAWYSETEKKCIRGIKYNIAGLIFSKVAVFENAKKYFEQALCIVKKIGDKRGEGSFLGNLGGACHNLGDYHKAIDYHERALDIAREIGDKSSEENWLGNLGSVYGRLGDYQKAINYFKQALSVAKEIGDKNGEGRHLGNLGNAYQDLGDYQKAIEYHKQALSIAKEIGDKNGEGRHLGHLGIAYRTLGNYQKAIEYHKQALSIAKEIGDKNGEGRHLGNLGTAYYSIGDSQKAIAYYEQALGIARKIGDKRGEGSRLDYLGMAYSSLDDYQKAIDYHEQALRIAREIGDKRGEGSFLGNLGEAYNNLGDSQKSMAYYEQALRIAREIGNKWGEGNCLGNLGVCYGNIGDYQKAITYSEQALDIFRPMVGDSHPYVSRIEEYLSVVKSKLKQ